MENNSAGLAILTAMITPAILILACGSLLLTTSQRLNRSIERARKISAELKDLKLGNKNFQENERILLYNQLTLSAKRAVFLQRSMTFLYVALFFFVTDSLIIGIFEIFGLLKSVILILLPFTGVLILFAACISFILETRLALKAVNEEMRFRLKEFSK